MVIQNEMFADADMASPAWEGHKGPHGRNMFWTKADMPGLVIKHCGHPTALRPYYCEYEGQPLTAWDIQPTIWPKHDRNECQNVGLVALRNLAPMKQAAEYWYKETIGEKNGS